MLLVLIGLWHVVKIAHQMHYEWDIKNPEPCTLEGLNWRKHRISVQFLLTSVQFDVIFTSLSAWIYATSVFTLFECDHALGFMERTWLDSNHHEREMLCTP